MSKHKNITKYTQGTHTMNGYRVCISRKGNMFVKYISETDAGTMREAEKLAIRLRDTILRACHDNPGREKDVMKRYSSMEKEAILAIAKQKEYV